MHPTIAEKMASAAVRELAAAWGSAWLRVELDVGAGHDAVSGTATVSSVDGLLAVVATDDRAAIVGGVGGCVPATLLALVDAAASVDMEAAVVVELFDDLDARRAATVTCVSYTERYSYLSAGWQVVLMLLVAVAGGDGCCARFIVATGAAGVSARPAPRRCHRHAPVNRRYW